MHRIRLRSTVAVAVHNYANHTSTIRRLSTAATGSAASTSASNQVMSWGSSHLGGTGHGTYAPQPTPRPIGALSSSDITSVASGWSRSYAVSCDGDVYEWGWTRRTFKHMMWAQKWFHRSPTLLRALQTYAPFLGVFSFRHAQITPTRIAQSAPISAAGGDAPAATNNALFDGAGIVQVATGGDHSVALDSRGRVWSWGVGYYGQLGHGAHTTQTHVKLPTLVQAFEPVSLAQAQAMQAIVNAAAAAAASTSSTDSAGDATASAGSKSKSKSTAIPVVLRPSPASDGSKLAPTATSSPAIRIVAVSAGFQHTLCLASTGLVYAMGKGSNGALGMWRITDGALSLSLERDRANDVHKRTDTPGCIQLTNAADQALHRRTPVMGQDVVAIGAGFAHSVFLDAQGRVWACGKNRGGECGTGDFLDVTIPRRVEGGGLGTCNVTKIAVGQHHTLALTNKHEVWSWGISKSGQCGRPSADAVLNEKAARAVRDTKLAVAARTMPTPARVDLSHLPAASRRIVDVYAGFYDSILVNDLGETIVFGGNNSQFGYNHTPLLDSLTPPAATATAAGTTDKAGTGGGGLFGGARVRSVAFGMNHTLAVVAPRN